MAAMLVLDVLLYYERPNSENYRCKMKLFAVTLAPLTLSISTQ